jgi:UDP-N-acetylmuramyl tripeptide synthase
MKSILEEWGQKVGLIGTIQYMIGDTVYNATHTTPEALEFQALLHEMLEAGCGMSSRKCLHMPLRKRVMERFSGELYFPI